MNYDLIDPELRTFTNINKLEDLERINSTGSETHGQSFTESKKPINIRRLCGNLPQSI